MKKKVILIPEVGDKVKIKLYFGTEEYPLIIRNLVETGATIRKVIDEDESFMIEETKDSEYDGVWYLSDFIL